MTNEQLSERIESIILDIDRMDGRSLYKAKQSLRALGREVKAANRELRLQLMAAIDQQQKLI